MKQKDILQKLAKAGFTFKEGANHIKAYDKEGIFRTTIGRHVEIPEKTANDIAKQTGVKLK